MRGWRHWALRVTLAATPACGPEPAPPGEQTTGEPGTDTGGPTTAQPTTTEPGSDTDACGPPPAPFACAPDDDGGLIDLICAARDQATCNGLIDPQTNGECRWEQTLVYAHDAVTCEDPQVIGACITFLYSSDGCEASTVCSDDRPGTIHYRTDENCQTQVFHNTRCGERLVGWNRCAWATPASDACPLPNPSSGPPLCNCAC